MRKRHKKRLKYWAKKDVKRIKKESAIFKRALEKYGDEIGLKEWRGKSD
jgi:hypothetical protein